MKYEVDLRTPEYLASQKFLKPPVIALLVVLAITFCTFSGLQAARWYKNSLQVRLTSAQETLVELQGAAEPFILMKEEIEVIEDKKALLDENINSLLPLASHLKTVTAVAAANRVELHQVSLAGCGDFTIQGRISQAKDAAIFNQDLASLPFVYSCQINKIDLSSDDKYHFMISGKLTAGEINEQKKDN